MSESTEKSFNGAAPEGAAPSAMRWEGARAAAPLSAASFLAAAVFCFALAFPAHPRFLSVESDTVSSAASSAADSALASVPRITDMYSEEFEKGEEYRAGEARRFGTFVISNPARVPFILRVLLAEGARLVRNTPRPAPARGRILRGRGPAGQRNPPYILIENLVLRYRGANGLDREKPLSDTDYRGKGYVYEIRFWAEDVQEVYEMELWGTLRGAREFRALQSGAYTNDAEFEIDVNL